MKEAEVIGALYARKSLEKQGNHSVDDQLRRCREEAARRGVVIPDELVFFDDGVSGTERGDHRREGYIAMKKAWDEKRFNVLIVDDFSRLSRDGVEQAKMIRTLEQSQRVRLVTVDGIDTAQKDWQLRLGLHGLLAQQDIRKLCQMVGRGMVGALELGYMIATPAFGYDLKRIYDDREMHIGSKWLINSQEAAIVREIFTRREAGQSMNQIAAWLNCEGVPITRKARKADGGFWRASRIRNLLSNSIYRGVFIWHGSTTYRAKAERRGDTVETLHYAREELRLVSDETWNRCQSKSISRSGYGGGKHALAGLLTCGLCGATLVLNSERPRRSVYCAVCTSTNTVTQDAQRLTSTVRVTGVEHLLRHALQYFLSPEFLTAFHNSLRLRLAGDSVQEVDACRARLKQLRAAQERYSHMLGEVTDEDAILMARYTEARQKVQETQTRLEKLEAGQVAVDARVIQAQLDADPAALLGSLFDGYLPPEKLRAVLSRLFPSIVFEGKSSRYTSFFRIRFVTGEAMSAATQSAVIEQGSIERRFQLQYQPASWGSQSRWVATVVDDVGPLLNMHIA